MTEPPATESGAVYKTVDARCEACVVKGGREKKCVNQDWEEFIGKPLGQVCPRVDLLSDLVPDAEILEFALSERLRPMGALRAELVAEAHGLSREDLNGCLSRVSYVLAEPGIAEILNPPMTAKG